MEPCRIIVLFHDYFKKNSHVSLCLLCINVTRCHFIHCRFCPAISDCSDSPWRNTFFDQIVPDRICSIFAQFLIDVFRAFSRGISALAGSNPADNKADTANANACALEGKYPLPLHDAIAPDPHTTTRYTPSTVDIVVSDNSKTPHDSRGAASILLLAPAKEQPIQIQ